MVRVALAQPKAHLEEVLHFPLLHLLEAVGAVVELRPEEMVLTVVLLVAAVAQTALVELETHLLFPHLKVTTAVMALLLHIMAAVAVAALLVLALRLLEAQAVLVEPELRQA